jgi:tetratricopeptide (TPR) repeat protein
MYCSKACQLRHWGEPPWGDARDKVVPEYHSSNSRLKATTNAQGHSIVKHKIVCPLLKIAFDEVDEHEAAMTASGATRSAQDYFYLGNAAMTRGQLGKAIAAYREVIRMEPCAAARYNLGIALQANGELDVAIAAYRDAIRIHPEHADTHYNLGIALAANGQLVPAIAAYREAIRIDPEHADTHCNLGNALRANGDNAGAKSSFESYLRLYPNSPHAATIRTVIAQLT